MAQIERRMNEEKEFHHYLDFPIDIQKVVIDEMIADDRCRFTRCSKQSKTDAQDSKNFVHQVEFILKSINYIEINVIYLMRPNWEANGYNLIFEEREGKQIKKYESVDSQKSWEIELEGSKTIFEHAVGVFKKMLQTYQNALRRLTVNDYSNVNNLGIIKFEFPRMRNLRIISVSGNVNLPALLSKLERPLRHLYIYRNNEKFYDQISQVVYSVEMNVPTITNEQFLQIKAKDVYIAIGKLTEMDIFQFIRSWQDGTIGREFYMYRWTMFNSTFDMRKLFRLLRLHDENRESGSVEIKHYIKTGKSAMFLWFPNQFKFRPINRIVRRQ